MAQYSTEFVAIVCCLCISIKESVVMFANSGASFCVGGVSREGNFTDSSFDIFNTSSFTSTCNAPCAAMAQYSTEFVVIVCCLLCVEMVVGVSLNLFILLKWFKGRKGLLHKATKSGNHFITTLKTMDLLICMSAVPFTVAVLLLDEGNNLVACFIKESVVMFANSGSSFCVLLVSLDRYSAVVVPTKPLFTRQSVKICRMCVFGVAIVGFFLPLLSLMMGRYYSAVEESKHVLPCRYVVWIFKPYYPYDFYYVVSFTIAVCVVFACYRSVLKVVRRRSEARTNIQAFPSTSATSDMSHERLRKQELKATRVTFGVVVSFIVCWGPHVIVTVIQYGIPTSIILDMIQVVCLFLAFLTPILHPVIYTYESQTINANVALTWNLPFFQKPSTRRISPEQTNTLSGENTFSMTQNISSVAQTQFLFSESTASNCRNTSTSSEHNSGTITQTSLTATSVTIGRNTSSSSEHVV